LDTFLQPERVDQPVVRDLPGVGQTWQEVAGLNVLENQWIEDTVEETPGCRRAGNARVHDRRLVVVAVLQCSTGSRLTFSVPAWDFGRLAGRLAGRLTSRLAIIRAG